MADVSRPKLSPLLLGQHRSNDMVHTEPYKDSDLQAGTSAADTEGRLGFVVA